MSKQRILLAIGKRPRLRYPSLALDKILRVEISSYTSRGLQCQKVDLMQNDLVPTLRFFPEANAPERKCLLGGLIGLEGSVVAYSSFVIQTNLVRFPLTEIGGALMSCS